MKERDFITWLHGFFEISGAKTLDEKQVQVIKDHLHEFFIKVTPDRNQDDNNEKIKLDIKKLQEQLDKIEREDRNIRNPCHIMPPSIPLPTYHTPEPTYPWTSTCTDTTSVPPVTNICSNGGGNVQVDLNTQFANIHPEQHTANGF